MSHGSDLRLTKRVLSLDQFMEKSKQELENSFAVFNNLSCNRFNDKQNKFIQQIT